MKQGNCKKIKGTIRNALTPRKCVCCNYHELVVLVRVNNGFFAKYKMRCDNCGNESDKRRTSLGALRRWNVENQERKPMSEMERRGLEKAAMASTEDRRRYFNWLEEQNTNVANSV